MREIKEIIIHYSDSAFGDAATIRQWHTSQKKEDGTPRYRDAAYHYIILNGERKMGILRPEDDGLIEPARPIDWDGGGVYQYHDGTLEVCLIGKKGTFTERQLEALEAFIRAAMLLFRSINKVSGHNAHGQTDCPGFDWKAWLSKIGLA